MSQLLARKKNEVSTKKPLTYSIQEYLDECKKNPSVYATTAQRLLKAIGEPTVVDTSKNPRLSRIFMNRTIKTYPAFSDFYGMEETIERVVNFFKYAAQGLEEKKQILYLLGPVGGGKSSLAERIKSLVEKEPVYILTYKGEISPVFESPLELFVPEDADDLHKEYSIPKNLITGLLSPWGVKRKEESGSNFTEDFGVIKLYPSKLKQICVAKTEPGDENNQDISALVGKTDIRKLEKFSQNDADSYSYSGGLNRTTQGILEFVEMFKAPIKMLHPLLTATQEGNYAPTENIGAIPYRGIILAHSNEAEWATFKNNKNNEAFIDRIYIVNVPYCLRVTEEALIYEKLLSSGELSNAPCAPHTLDILAQFSILSRLVKPSNGKIFSKMRIYDGETLKDTDPNAKPLQEYKDVAGIREGMDGSSTRFAFKILSQVFNFDPEEIAADPVHLLYVLEKAVIAEQLPKEKEEYLKEIIKSELSPRYKEKIGEEINKAYIESFEEFGQNLFDQYVAHADAWLEDVDYKDPDTGQLLNREILNKELEKLEKPSGIVNTKDFRNEIVKFVLKARNQNGGNNPSWQSFEKIREVIEKRVFSQMDDLLPVISFGTKKDTETAKKHGEFVERMKARGYTEKQIRRLVEWYIRTKQSS